MMTERARNFWNGFNIGHVLILIGMAGSLMTVYNQRERDLALLKFASDAQFIQLSALQTRMEIQERAGARLEVVANDIAWIKAELQKRPRE